MSVRRKRFRTALPKEPVPPVIRRVLSLNTLMVGLLLFYKFTSFLVGLGGEIS